MNQPVAAQMMKKVSLRNVQVVQAVRGCVMSGEVYSKLFRDVLW
jgi:hypothetical protein